MSLSRLRESAVVGRFFYCGAGRRGFRADHAGKFQADASRGYSHRDKKKRTYSKKAIGFITFAFYRHLLPVNRLELSTFRLTAERSAIELTGIIHRNREIEIPLNTINYTQNTARLSRLHFTFSSLRSSVFEPCLFLIDEKEGKRLPRTE